MVALSPSSGSTGVEPLFPRRRPWTSLSTTGDRTAPTRRGLTGLWAGRFLECVDCDILSTLVYSCFLFCRRGRPSLLLLLPSERGGSVSTPGLLKHSAVCCRVYALRSIYNRPSGQGCAGVGLPFMIWVTNTHLSRTAGGVAEYKQAPFELFTRSWSWTFLWHSLCTPYCCPLVLCWRGLKWHTARAMIEVPLLLCRFSGG